MGTNCNNKVRLTVIESQSPLGWKTSSPSLNHKPFFKCKLNFIKLTVFSREREYLAFKGTGQMLAQIVVSWDQKNKQGKLGALVSESRDLRRFMTEWRYFSEMTHLINLSFHHETGEILELPTCGLCSISVPGDIQNFTECWPKQADKRWPFFEEGVGWTRRPLKVLYNFMNFFFF